jgi:hypothetical protein
VEKVAILDDVVAVAFVAIGVAHSMDAAVVQLHTGSENLIDNLVRTRVA